MKNAIYKIQNNINNKCYIGSTVRYNIRRSQHLYYLRKGKHHSIKLQRAWNKYGEDNFTISIVESFEYINVLTLLQREQYYIDTFNPEYNMRLIAGSEGNQGLKRSEEFKKNLSKIMKSKGHTAWNKGKSTMTKEHKEKLAVGRANGKKREITDELRKKMSEGHSTPVLQYDESGILIKEWKNLVDVSKNMPCSKSKLCEYLKGKSNINTFKKCIWKYKNQMN